ncbi:MAG: HEPN domain-containing protein [Myxococcota bacterium]
MSPVNLRENVAYELTNAERLLRVAEVLLTADGFPDAVNRAYYAVFHLGVAMLLVLGHEPRSHAGAKALLGSELVRRGLLPPEAAQIFTDLEKGRLASDYRRFVSVTREDAEAAVRQARTFESMARTFLSTQGF